jgi:hypothetical protein
MDEKGRNVLLLTSGLKSGDGVATAKVLEAKSGRLIKEYRQQHIQHQSLKLPIIHNEGKHDNISTILPIEITEAAVKWKFSDLVIEFNPISWNLIVKCNNKRVICMFSTLTGGKMLSPKNIKAKEIREREKERGMDHNELISLSPKKYTIPKTDIQSHIYPQSHHVNAHLSTEQHKNLQHDVGNILNNLDNLLKDINLDTTGVGRGGAIVGRGGAIVTDKILKRRSVKK